jgi:primosomal protein N' (replication factor Y)
MQRTHSVEEPDAQPSMRAPVLMPALVEGAFDYLVPVGTPEGRLVEATLAGRRLVGAVWKDMIGADAQGASRPHPPSFGLAASGSHGPSVLRTPEIPIEKLKPIARVIDNLPPLSANFMKWLDWVSEFTLAPKGAVLSLCGLAHAAKVTRKQHAPQVFTLAMPQLTDEQRHAAQAIEAAVENSCEGETKTPLTPLLLDGVTGSGKTEVYYHGIEKAVAHGLQVLVLVPEISLTHQWLERFEKTFGCTPVIWHSRMTPAAKARAWQAVARGEVQVVVGARSALFLPFAKLGLIVVDEEHDPSYKQEDGVLYHARDMAVVRARFENVPIVLVSATPSLETLENVREGKYRALHLVSRYGSAGMPDVRLVDLRNEPPERGEFLSPTVKQAMLNTLARGEQVLFFLNRRGYAPLLLCRACGHRFQCSDCSAWLVVHGRSDMREGGIAPHALLPPSATRLAQSATHGKTAAWLSCHHCGHKEPMPKECPNCKAEADKLAPCGPGVERIAEEVRGLFGCVRSASEPLAAGVVAAGDEGGASPPSIITLSSDESITAETWAQIEAGKVDILVGTQMVAKGHHFPRLTLVVVVDADVGLDGADLRAGERTYQMLHQLGGRAGRGELAGQVLVQTYCPEHPVMKALVAHDRDRLMALEAKERKAGNWPPFGQLAAILLDGKDEAAVRHAGQMLARTAPDDARLKVLGPAPAPLSKLRGQYRYRLLIKAQTGIHLQRTLKGWLASQKFKGVRIKVDVNPYYFM